MIHEANMHKLAFVECTLNTSLNQIQNDLQHHIKRLSEILAVACTLKRKYTSQRAARNAFHLRTNHIQPRRKPKEEQSHPKECREDLISVPINYNPHANTYTHTQLQQPFGRRGVPGAGQGVDGRQREVVVQGQAEIHDGLRIQPATAKFTELPKPRE